jgi:CTP synthase
VHNPKHQSRWPWSASTSTCPDAYLSVTEALRAGGFANKAKVNIRWVPSDDCDTPEGAAKALAGADADLRARRVRHPRPGGQARRPAVRPREQDPHLGLCLGLQCMVIEYARNVVGLENASSSEFEPDTKFPVIATMAEQLSIVAGEGDMGGTMRLGLWEARLDEGSVVAGTYGKTTVTERHRHRYEVNNEYRAQIAEAGLVFSGSLAGRQAGGVRRAPPGRPPVLRLHPGPPRLSSRPTRLTRSSRDS